MDNYTYNCGDITEDDGAFVAPFSLGWWGNPDVVGLPSRFWISVREPFSEHPVTDLIAMEPDDASRGDVWQDYREVVVTYVRGHVGSNPAP